MKNHPHLYRLYNIFHSEEEPFRKVHRLIDCFECFIKMYTAVLLCEYYQKKDISNEMRQLLYEGLRNPSLGTWQKFSDKIFDELKIKKHKFLIDGFEEGFENLKKYVERNSEDNLIKFRNKYAHGATPSNVDCITDVKHFSPYLEKLANEKWLSESVTFVNNSAQVCIKNSKGQSLSLFPILVTERTELNNHKIVYFNDLDYNNGDVGLLNYITARRFRDIELFSHFNKTYRLTQWQNASKTKDFEKKRRIEDLTISFTGREKEIKFINDFISNNSKGFLTITGNPGMGKSTLIAEVFKKLDKTYSSATYPILYFVQRGSGNDAYSLLKYLHDKIDESKILLNKKRGNNAQEMFNSLQEKLNAWSQRSKGKKLLIIIDGLDEGIEPPNNFITDYLFNQPIPQVLFIYSTRPGGHDKIVDFLDILPRENTTRLALTGLTKENIRALLYEVTNKYEIQQDWVDVILEKSQGSALYLKLLCKDIQQDRIVVNNTKALPNDINEFYESILKKYRKLPEKDTILNSIFLFAIAKDGLTQHHLELILNIGTGTSINILSVLKEVLLVDENNSNAYILFHESLRSYILEKFPSNILDAHKKVVSFCEKWETLKGKLEHSYSLKYYYLHLLHLSEKNNFFKQQLLLLAKNVAYQAEQKNELQSFNATQNLLAEALRLTCSQQNTDAAIDFTLSLIELKREEQNDYQEIFNLLNQGNYSLALKRIAYFGSDADAYNQPKIKFILYMLCMQKFTLGDFKEHQQKKEICNQLLLHLDKHLTTDHSLLNWDDFYPSNLMYLIAVELKRIGLDDTILWKRTETWKYDFIKFIGEIDDIGFEVLINAAFCIKKNNFKSNVLKEIGIGLYSKGKNNEAKDILKQALTIINNSSDNTLIRINNNDNRWWHTNTGGKFSILKNIAEGFIKINEIDTANSIIQQAILLHKRVSEIPGLIYILFKLGKVDQAIKFVNSLSNKREEEKVESRMALARELFKINKIEEAKIQILIAYSAAIEIKKISLVYESRWANRPNYGFMIIGQYFAEMGKINEAFEALSHITDEDDKQKIFIPLAGAYTKIGQLKEGLDLVSKIKNSDDVEMALNEIVKNLLRLNNYEEVKNIFIRTKKGITSKFIDAIINDYPCKYSIKQVLFALTLSDNINYYETGPHHASIFITEDSFVKSQKVIYKELISTANSINKKFISKTISSILDYIDKNNNYPFIEKALYWSLYSLSNFNKSSLYYNEICNHFVSINKVELAIKIFKYNLSKNNILYRGGSAENIVDALVKNSRIEDALSFIENIELTPKSLKNELYCNISSDAITKIAEALITENTFEDLLIFFLKCYEPWDNNFSYNNIDLSYIDDIRIAIAQKLLELKRIDDAIAIVSFYSRPISTRLSNVLKLAELLTKTREFKLAERMIKEGISLYELNKDELLEEFQNTELLGSVNFPESILKFALLQSRIGNSKFVTEYLELFLIIYNNANSQNKEWLVKILAEFYFELNNLEMALQVLIQLNDGGAKVYILKKFAQNYYLNYGLDPSINITKNITNEQFKKYWLLELIAVIMPNEVDSQNLLMLLFMCSDSTTALENILMHYSVAQGFFTDERNTKHLNKIAKVLDIQNILETMPAPFSNPEDNIEKWLKKFANKNINNEFQIQ